ncbi:hypothetical protein J4729_07170 [Leisingera sp. HS039]|uniref:hypothetical protein n=1 Tax=Leisingera sp. HS039 TaxID=2818496 RepID=UPI001B3A6942|nr:hypothetical protein [Leisingera sp. HS039]MBQ4824331.1 hypothetical protein [Leisingera sp. HS039]
MWLQNARSQRLRSGRRSVLRERVDVVLIAFGQKIRSKNPNINKMTRTFGQKIIQNQSK